VPDTNAWQQFVATVISHYTDIGMVNNITFGIWNEPDGRFLTGCPSGYDQSSCWGILLWIPAAQARDSVNPAAQLAGPEMGNIDSRLNNALYWMSQDSQPQDIVSTHWYPGAVQYLEDWVNTVHQASQGTGLGYRSVWITESGVNECDNGTQAGEVYQIIGAFNASSADEFYYYQVVTGTAEACFGITNRPSAQQFLNWANYFNPPSGGAATILQGGTIINPGDQFASPNGQFVLTYQTDGNFVLYNNGSPVWAINCWPTCNSTGFEGNAFAPAGYATMQTDGNLVVYNGYGGPDWHTYTFGNPGAYLAIQNDGNLVVYSSSGAVLWQR
jgi:hypothetical protein